MEDMARPQPRSSTFIPGFSSIAPDSHSVIHNALDAPLALATTHSGLYFAERGNRSEISRSSEFISVHQPEPSLYNSSSSNTTTPVGTAFRGRPPMQPLPPRQTSQPKFFRLQRDLLSEGVETNILFARQDNQ